MSTSVSPEKLAMLLHHYSEALAPDFGLRPSPTPEWEDLSQDERNRMIAAARLTLLDLRDAQLPRESHETSHETSRDMPFPDFAGGTEGKECGA